MRWVLSLIAVASAMGCVEHPEQAPRDDCVVGASPAGNITDHDVRALRSLIMPAPERIEARRLAFDAFVADALLHDGPRPEVPETEHLKSYAQLQKQAKEETEGPVQQAKLVVTRLHAAEQHFHIRRGLCHPGEAR